MLAGHSVSAIIAEAPAYSFHNVDGLMVLSYSDTDVSPADDINAHNDAVATNLANVKKIRVPVLMMTGDRDASYPVLASEQAKLMTGSYDVTAVTIAGNGHALTLHGSRDQVSQLIAAGLEEHRLS